MAVALIGASAPASAQVCATPPPGALYWLGAQHSLDDLAGHHHGTQGTGASLAFVPGHVGTALRFDQVEDTLFTDVTKAEQRAHRSAFSFEMWVRPGAALASCPEADSGTCGIGLPWAVYPENGSNSDLPGESAAGIGIAVGTNGVCVGQHAFFLASCLARIDTPIAHWTHVAVVVEDKTPRIYLNGTLAHTGLASSKQFVFPSWSVLGQIAGFGAYIGDLDEVTVYGRALASAEIAQLAAAGSAGKCPTACPAPMAGDAWQGAGVVQHSALLSNSADCLFGASSCTPEPDSLLFADGLADGTVHTVEWQTQAHTTIGAFAVHASEDAAGAPARRFRHLRLQARDELGALVTMYEGTVPGPYGQGPQQRDLQRCLRLRPMRARQFRAEFVQDGSSAASGPRVIELDGLIHDPIFAHDYE